MIIQKRRRRIKEKEVSYDYTKEEGEKGKRGRERREEREGGGRRNLLFERERE